MHRVMEQPRDYWRNENLPNCFIDSLENLLIGLKSRKITDIFFPEVLIKTNFIVHLQSHIFFQVNLLHRIKNPQVIDDVVGYIERKLRAYYQTRNILIFF